jgi:F-type H+-transporting ATPase subunit b
MRILATLALALAASPALAATGDYGFFSLQNTDFVVLLAFLVLLGILYYFGRPRADLGPSRSSGPADPDRADEARALRVEAQQLLGSFDASARR